ncbi:MAG TPA: hypothetical protein PK006_11570 [Saprospiraceae bacterium]|nr:hypothetical protein [Saprospiraceae bacterium]
MNSNKRILLLSGLFILVFLSRLIPHQPNFIAMSAGIIFSAGILGLPGLLSCILAYFSADLIVNHVIYGLPVSPNQYVTSFVFVYSCYMINYLILRNQYRRKEIGALSIAQMSLLSSILFFVVSNFGVWINDALYPKTLTGLISCYTMAIPFFSYELAGTLFFSCVIFGSYFLVTRNRNSINLQQI